MRMCDRGIQMLVTTLGAFAAFSLMTIAVGTDYWLYSRGVCRTKSLNDNDTSRKNEEVLTHSGLWRTCCLEGTFRGICKQINHFPEDADYEQDAAEYLLRAVRASSIFPILSVGLLFFGGLCVAASEFYKSKLNVILSAGIFFVSAGLSNIIGIIVYISANAGDPGQSDSKKSYSYGWSFYFGALSFIIAEMVGVIAVHMYIEKHRQIRAKSHSVALLKKSTFARLPTYRYRFRRRSSSRSTEPRSRDLSPIGKGFTAIPSTDISMFTLSRDPSKDWKRHPLLHRCGLTKGSAPPSIFKHPTEVSEAEDPFLCPHRGSGRRHRSAGQPSMLQAGMGDIPERSPDAQWQMSGCA